VAAVEAEVSKELPVPAQARNLDAPWPCWQHLRQHLRMRLRQLASAKHAAWAEDRAAPREPVWEFLVELDPAQAPG
jgi:hypothetical protein